MKCPCCGGAELIADIRVLPYVYRGRPTVVPGISGEHCPECGEVLLSKESGDRYSAATQQFRQSVDEAIDSSDYDPLLGADIRPSRLD